MGFQIWGMPIYFTFIYFYILLHWLIINELSIKSMNTYPTSLVGYGFLDKVLASNAKLLATCFKSNVIVFRMKYSSKF